MGIMEMAYRWQDHFSLEEIDSIMSGLIKVKIAEAHPKPTVVMGSLLEADYHRLKLHYRIELFCTNNARANTLNNLSVILDDVYNRLKPTVENGARVKRGKK